MKKLSCKEMGIKACSFVAVGMTDKEVKNKLNDHAKKVHADVIKGMSQADMEKMNDQMDKLLAKQK